MIYRGINSNYNIVITNLINPFLANVPILYPLKIPEKLWFSGVFWGYKMGTLARNRLPDLARLITFS